MNISTTFIAITIIAGTLLPGRNADAQTISTSTVISVTNSGSPQGIRELSFGVTPSATNGIDAELGEELFPPFPPTASFEARFVTHGGGELGEGSPSDFRPFTSLSQIDEFKIKIQPGTNGLPVTVTWDREYMASHYTSAVISDPFGGVILTADMRTTGSVRIDNAALTEVVIRTEGPKDPSNGVDDARPAADRLDLAGSWSAADERIAIDFTLARAGDVSLRLLDIRGERVATLLDGERVDAGRISRSIDASAIPEGPYVVSLECEGTVAGRMLLIVR